MIKNWKIAAELVSPLAGNPPEIDSILEWELSMRMGSKHHLKLTRSVPLSDIVRPPIPVAKRTFRGVDVYCCSSPVMEDPDGEWVDHHAKRFESSKMSLLLSPKNRGSLLIGSGPFKMRFVPIRVRRSRRIVWFVRGARKEINKLLKSIVSLGKHRNIGYGLIGRWLFEEMEKDHSIFSYRHGKKVLMKAIPMCDSLRGVTGYRKSFGGVFPPYWHPETQMDIAVPC